MVCGCGWFAMVCGWFAGSLESGSAQESWNSEEKKVGGCHFLALRGESAVAGISKCSSSGWDGGDIGCFRIQFPLHVAKPLLWE
jgi:hypothetical protein